MVNEKAQMFDWEGGQAKVKSWLRIAAVVMISWRRLRMSELRRESERRKVRGPSSNTNPYDGSTLEKFYGKYVPFFLDFVDQDV